ncbi:MAG: long-chain fatty acid--CoA ligase [Alphaproteobacteria bacterium]|nr:long-chain fatty acid--CoA ligase [Alphaproteobacteria bacterium]
MAGHVWEKSYPPGVSWELEVPRKGIHEVFEESCAANGERPFTDFLDKVMSFRDYKEATDRAAAGFQKLGVKPGVHVGLYLPNTPHYIIAFFGVLKAGGRVVNYSPLDAERELEHKISDSETDILVTLDVKALYPKMAGMRGKTRLKKLIVGSIADFLPWPKNWLYPIAKKADINKWPRDDWHMSFKDLLANDGRYQAHKISDDIWDEVALLQYTGGTTGLPKAAMLTHGCIMAAMSQGQAWTKPYTTPGTEKVVCVLPLFHIYALSGIMLGAVRNGNQLILYPRPDIDMIVKDLGTKRPSFLPGVPTLYTAINKHPLAKQLDLKSLKICMSGGAPLPVEVQNEFEKLTGATLIEGYGLTETSPTGCICPVDKAVRRVGSCGVPMPGTIVEIRSLDDHTKVLPPGKDNVGEVCIVGPQVMKGYWNKADETDKVLFTHPTSNWKGLRTGDMGYMDEDGWVFLVDRSKDLIISSGYNVYPRVIEEATYEHPAVDECIVIGIYDEYRGEAPKVFVKLKPGASLTFDELKKHLDGKIGKHEFPVAFEVRSELPKTPVGKLSKKELKAEEAAKRATANKVAAQ